MTIEKLLSSADSLTVEEVHQHPFAALDKIRGLTRELRRLLSPPPAVPEGSSDVREALAAVIFRADLGLDGLGGDLTRTEILSITDRILSDPEFEVRLRRTDTDALYCAHCQNDDHADFACDWFACAGAQAHGREPAVRRGAWLAERPHEFEEDVDDGSMCLCGAPAQTHHVVEPSVQQPEHTEGSKDA